MKISPVVMTLLALGINAGCLPLASASQKPVANQVAASTVNMNEASVANLTTLKGIGKKTAEAIVARRAELGRFKSADDLIGIQHITQRRLDRLMKDNPGRIKF